MVEEKKLGLKVPADKVNPLNVGKEGGDATWAVIVYDWVRPLSMTAMMIVVLPIGKVMEPDAVPLVSGAPLTVIVVLLVAVGVTVMLVGPVYVTS